MGKPYASKSLPAANREVRRLRRMYLELDAIALGIRQERNVMARLAAKKPQFFNPLEVAAAEKLRDDILRTIPGANI